MTGGSLARTFTFLLAALMSGPADAAPAIVVARGADAGEDPPPELVTELAQRCPARQVPFSAIAPLLPRLSRLDAGAAPPPLPEALSDAASEFFRSEDLLGSAARFSRAIRALEEDPVALLAFPERRLRLRDAHLYAARALLQAGRADEARAQLLRAAARLPDLPPPPEARWGPAMATAAADALRLLPPPSHVVIFEGPKGWAIHLDEQPVGPLPRQQARLRPGSHAAVAVGPEGLRVSWRIELPEREGPLLRLRVDPHLSALCARGELAGICERGDPPPGAAALAALLGEDVIVLRRAGGELVGHRVGAEPRSARAPLDATAPERLAPALCPPPLPPKGAAAAGSACPAAAPATVRRLAPSRAPLWPSAILFGAGGTLALGAAPLFVLDGRCVEHDCALVYDFRGLPLGVALGGAALTFGGVLWLAIAPRRSR